MELKPKSLSILLLVFFAVSCSSTPGTRSLSKEEQVEGLLNIASASISENDLISGLEHLNRVKELDDSNPRTEYLYALAYLGKNEKDLAEKSARRAIKLDPSYSAAKNALGRILLDQGRLEEAEPLLKAAANDLYYREASLSKINLGLLYLKKLDYKNSESWLNKALFEKGPLTCMAHFYFGKLKTEQRDLKAASRSFGSAIKGSCSGNSEIHIALGQSLVREKKYDLARAKLIEIQKLFPNSDASDRAADLLREIP